MSDPTPFLSTIAGTSAAMVAIIGGLLVARFVTIISDRDGAQRLLGDAKSRAAIARKRAREARDGLRLWYINDFFNADLIRAIGGGEQDIPTLRRIGNYTALTDDEITSTVQAIVSELIKARATLRELISLDATAEYPEWTDFKHTNPSLPETAWDEAWEIAYEDIVRPPGPPEPSVWGDFSFTPSIPLITPPEYVALDIQRRDALRTDVARAEQHVEDVEEELARLKRARDAIVRPKGLGWGLVVLGFFTLVGVIIPIWIMSRAPQRLTAHLGEVVFWLFLAGLLGLLGYMVALALRLSGWRQNTENDDNE